MPTKRTPDPILASLKESLAKLKTVRAKKPPKPVRGGKRAGAGRPALDPDEPTVTISVRLLKSQRAKYLELGGAAWFRGQVDKAAMPRAKRRG